MARYQVTIVGAIIGTLAIGGAIVAFSSGSPLAAGFLITLGLVVQNLLTILQAEVNGHRLANVEDVAAGNTTAIIAGSRRADRTDVATGVDTFPKGGGATPAGG
jgi:hypothetical protein